MHTICYLVLTFKHKTSLTVIKDILMLDMIHSLEKAKTVIV